MSKKMRFDGAFIDPDTAPPPKQLAGGPDVAISTSGVTILVGGNTDGDRGGISAWIFDPAGQPITPVFIVNQRTQGDQNSPRVAALANGSFAVTWWTMGQIGGFGRIVMPDGSMPLPERQLLDFETAALPGGGTRASACNVRRPPGAVATPFERRREA